MPRKAGSPNPNVGTCGLVGIGVKPRSQPTSATKVATKKTIDATFIMTPSDEASLCLQDTIYAFMSLFRMIPWIYSANLVSGATMKFFFLDAKSKMSAKAKLLILNVKFQS